MKKLILAITLGTILTIGSTTKPEAVDCGLRMEDAIIKGGTLYIKYRNNCTWEISIAEIPWIYLPY